MTRSENLLRQPVLTGLAFALLMLPSPSMAHSQEAALEEASTQQNRERLPLLSPAEFDEELAIGGEEIEARKLSSRMTTEVFLNGEGPFKFIVDSGADTSVVGIMLAARLNLPDADAAMLHAMTESKMVDRVKVDSLKLGPTTTTGLELPVLSERYVGGSGMIGLDALVEQRLMLDFEDKIITVEDGSTPVRSLPNEIIVTARLNRGQLILTQVRALDQDVQAVIDTGTEVTIGNSALRDVLWRRSPKSFKTVEIIGVTGARAEIEFAKIPRLKLGPVTFQDVAIAFADVPPFEVFGLSEQPSLLLGTDLMENFRRVSLDFKERKVRFQLKKCSASRATIRTTRTMSRIAADRASACAR